MRVEHTIGNIAIGVPGALRDHMKVHGNANRSEVLVAATLVEGFHIAFDRGLLFLIRCGGAAAPAAAALRLNSARLQLHRSGEQHRRGQ